MQGNYTLSYMAEVNVVLGEGMLPSSGSKGNQKYKKYEGGFQIYKVMISSPNNEGFGLEKQKKRQNIRKR